MKAVKIEIQEKLWYIMRGDEKLSYLTAFGTDSAFKKRSETGLSWAHGYRNKGVENEPVICPNTLMGGFKIIDNVSRWSTSNVVWRVLDPRGFEVEIYSGNMMEIVKCAEIKNGEIMTKCIWGRESGKNVLLPESSEPYISAVEFTKKKDVKIAIKDINPGDIITLKSNQKYEYLGHYYSVYNDYVEATGARELRISPKKWYFLLAEGKNIVAQASLNIIDRTTDVCVADHESYTNELLQNHEWGSYINGESVFAVVSDVPTQLEFLYKDVSYNDIKDPKNQIWGRRKYTYILNEKYFYYSDEHYGSRESTLDYVLAIDKSTPNLIQPAIYRSSDWRGNATFSYNKMSFPINQIVKVQQVYAMLNNKEYRIFKFI